MTRSLRGTWVWAVVSDEGVDEVVCLAFVGVSQGFVGEGELWGLGVSVRFLEGVSSAGSERLRTGSYAWVYPPLRGRTSDASS